MAAEPVTIKKYANRRLYNTGTSTYVTLEDLASMVKAGEDFIVHASTDASQSEKREDNSSNGPLSLAALSGGAFIGVPYLPRGVGWRKRASKPSGRFFTSDWRPLHPTARTPPFWKSASCQTRSFADVGSMSGLPAEAAAERPHRGKIS